MALFFFQVIKTDNTALESPEAQECPGVAWAARLAIRLAEQLACEPECAGGTVLVTDDEANHVAEVLIKAGSTKRKKGGPN